MMLQILADGLILGSIISLGAIGLSFTFSIFRFSNFNHGELLAWGAYLALVINTFLTKTLQGLQTPIHPFSFGWSFVIAMPIAAAASALLALFLDAILFRRLRKQGSITLVIASFGASLVLRNVLQYWQGGVPKYYSQNLQMALNFVPRSFHGGLRFTPDQLLVVGLTLLIVIALHVFLRYSVLGRSMRATAIIPILRALPVSTCGRSSVPRGSSARLWRPRGSLSSASPLNCAPAWEVNSCFHSLLPSLWVESVQASSFWGAVIGGWASA